jgi:hypothetical protein
MKITKRQLRRIIKEAMAPLIGSGDPTTEILDWAEEGNRVTVAGKNIWAGLGNRSGLHSYADELTSEKWGKSGDRFAKKIMNLPAGTEVELKRFQNTDRDRGKWVTAGTVTTTGPAPGAGPKPSASRMRSIHQGLDFLEISPHSIQSVTLYQADDNPFTGKAWELTFNDGRRTLFPDKAGDSYADFENGNWEIYSYY